MADEALDHGFAGTLVPGPQSPSLPEDDSEVLVLAAPATISPGGPALVSGAVRMKMGRFGRTDHAAMAVLVAVGPSGQSFLRRAFEELGEPAEEELEPTPLEDALVTTWFHTDLFEGREDPAAGVWCVHAFMGPYRSNGVSFEVLPAEDEP